MKEIIAELVTVKCHCENVEFQSYDNVVSMKAPFPVPNHPDGWVCIDTCIATAIGYLWNQGVVTINSCCGHSKSKPTVVVEKGSIEKMKELGYGECTDERFAIPEQTFAL